jgi:hypothetical protein
MMDFRRKRRVCRLVRGRRAPEREREKERVRE